MLDYAGMTLDSLAEQLEDINAALNDAEEDLFLQLRGGTYCASIELTYPIWDTESDDREWDEEGNGYTQTVAEYTIQRLERLSAALLVAAYRARKSLLAEKGRKDH